MNKHKSDGAFENKISQQLDNCLTGIDENIKQRLSANRQQVLTKAKTYPARSIFSYGWKPSSALAVMSLLLVTASISLFSTDDNTAFNNENNLFLTTDYNSLDDAVISDYELLSDLEFISWLLDEEYQDENNAS